MTPVRNYKEFGLGCRNDWSFFNLLIIDSGGPFANGGYGLVFT